MGRASREKGQRGQRRWIQFAARNGVWHSVASLGEKWGSGAQTVWAKCGRAGIVYLFKSKPEAPGRMCRRCERSER